MIRCVRLFSGHDGQSHVQLGTIAMTRPGEAGPSMLSDLVSAEQISVEDPWQRVYVRLPTNGVVPFTPEVR